MAKTNDKIAINFIKMLRLGPLVSFNGSPTVSPTTAALWTSLPFPIGLPFSSLKLLPYMYFLALSHAPPVLAEDMAICTPETMAPGRKPAMALGPKMTPINNGVRIT